jgi:nitrite reductase/ring-hydroxylating ferredoxin subunit
LNGTSSWVAVASEKELDTEERLVVTLNGQSVLLLRREGVIYAIGNQCPHLGCSLKRGQLNRYLLVCPCHSWTFDIRTGEMTIAREITLPVYQVKSENHQIFLEQK